MEIQSKNTKTNGYFKAVENGEEAGVMTYKWSEVGEMIIKNTTVHKAFKGKGIGSQLVMAAVQYARENHIKIVPLCPYAKSVFDKSKEIQDVLFS